MTSVNPIYQGGSLIGTPDHSETYAHIQTGRSRAALRGLFWSALNTGLPTLTAFAVFAVTSRFLVPAQFGIVALAGSIVTLAGALAPSGFGDALVQYKGVEKRHLDTVFWLCSGAAVGAYLILLLLSWPIAYLFHQPELVLLLAVLGTRLIFDLTSVVPSALLSRSMSFKLVARRTAVASLASAAICLGLLYAGFGLWALVLSQLVAAIIGCLTSIISVSWRPTFHFDKPSFEDLRRFGLFSSGNRFINLLAVDQLAIGGLLGTTALGLYGFARRLFQTVILVVNGAVGPVSNSLLASLQGEKEKMRQVFRVATFASAAVSFPLFVGLAIVSDDLVPLVFGQQWVAAIPALQGFCAIGLITCIGVLQASLINSQGKADWWMYYQIAQQITTLLVILFAYRFGVTTLVVCIAIKSWLAWPVTVMVTIRILGISTGVYLKPFVPTIVATAVMSAGVLVGHSALASSGSIVRLIAEVLIGAIIFPLVLVILGQRNLQEIKMLVKSRA